MSTEPRVWFNSELRSSWILLPGSIAIIMTIIGTLLTALVVAREWERGTMEALITTPIGIAELLVRKLTTYYLLGMGSMAVCVITSVTLFDVPFRGSVLALVLISSVFLIAILRDKRSRLLLIVPPLTQMIIFSFAATLEVKNVSIGILNNEHAQASRELAQRFHGAPSFRHITYLNGVAEIAPLIDSQQALLVLHIASDFSRQVEAGQPAEVQFILDGRRSNAAQIVQGYASRIVNEFKVQSRRLSAMIQMRLLRLKRSGSSNMWQGSRQAGLWLQSPIRKVFSRSLVA